MSEALNVTAAERTMLILEQLSIHSSINLEDLAKECNLPKATLYRFLQTLISLGYVRRDKNDKYSLTLRMFSVGSTSLEHTDLLNIARPIAEELSEHTGETVHIGMLEKTRAVYVLKIESAHTIRMFSRVGKRIPLHCTAIGKVFLSNLNTEKRTELFKKMHTEDGKFKKFTKNTLTTDEQLNEELIKVSNLGYAHDNQEHEEGITCFAAPIRDTSGNVVAAISVSFPYFRFPKEKTEEIATQIKKTATEISVAAGFKN
ncbi:MAG: IclR family transcriptional regulator [Treponema sp.]|nr:IclR family transcriptional regulator [Treponema sp.]